MSFRDVLGGLKTAGQMLGGVLTGKGMDAFKPTVDHIVKMITDANGLVDLQSGKTKSGVDAMVAGVKNSIVRQLGVEKIPVAKRAFSGNADDTYLSKELTSKVITSIEDNKKGLGEIADSSFMADYKRASLDFCDKILSDLKEYSNQFKVFTDYKVFKIFTKRVGFDDIKKARGRMRILLKDMLKITNAYTENNKQDNKYTYEGIKNLIISMSYGFEFDKGSIDKLEENVANTIFERALTCLRRFEGKQIGKDGKEVDKKEDHVLMKELDALKSSKEIDSTKNRIVDDIVYAMQLTQGIKINWNANTHEATIDCPKDISARKNYLGFKQCLHVASSLLESLTNNNSNTTIYDDIKLSEPLMGDCALELYKCFIYTESRLDAVINLGAKDNELHPPKKSEVVADSTESKVVVDPAKGKVIVDFKKGKGIGVDLKTVLGEDFYKKNVKWAKREKTINKSVTKGLLRKMTKACNDSYNEYKKIKKLQKEYFPKEEDRKDNLSKLIVTLDSKSEETGKKEYNIEERYNEQIKPLEDEALRSSNKEETQEEKDNRVSLAYRKAEKFLRACKQWNADFKVHKTELKKRREELILTVKRNLKRASVHKKELLSEEGITQDQKDAIKKAYKGLPSFQYTYLKKYEENEQKMDDFLGWHFDNRTKKLFSRNNKVIC